jgi:hypothetical protein
VFAARLAERTGLPLIHLDAMYWRPGWVKTPKDEWSRTVDRLLTRDRWVMDGNYAGTLDRRLAACDTVIFLDLPRTVCLWRAVVHPRPGGLHLAPVTLRRRSSEKKPDPPRSGFFFPPAPISARARRLCWD